jgi:geranylgeranyl reductase family protein
MHDVVVIGAGPAGATAAAALAVDGHDVVVVEEHLHVGSPVHCTGLLGWDAFREFALPSAIVRGEAGSARFWGRTGTPVHARGDRARAAVIDRAALDELLAQRAIQAGAALRVGWRADRIAVDDRGVEVHGRGGTSPLRSRAVVLACGANYRLHRDLGLGVPPAFLQTAQSELAFPAQTEVDVRFGRDLAPGGFAWVVPLTCDGVSRARIGVMSETRSADRHAAFVRDLCRQHGLNPEAVPPPRRKFLPLAPIARTYAPRVLAVGDAAGLVKPTTGGGIYYGLISGELAAGVLSDALRRDRVSDLAAYQREWQRRLGKEIRAGLAFRRATAGLSDETIDALLGLARVNGVLPLLQDHAVFNWHRQAALALLRHTSVRRLLSAVRHPG